MESSTSFSLLVTAEFFAKKAGASQTKVLVYAHKRPAALLSRHAKIKRLLHLYDSTSLQK